MPKAIIMAGGPGERFWPLTHKGFPKYRIRLDSRESLLQKTYRRLRSLYAKEDIYVVTTREHLGLIRSELPRLGKAHVLVEPQRRNTAAAVYFSCDVMAHKFGDREIVTFFPADHLIQNAERFRKTIQKAVTLARRGQHLVTIGIHPTFAATGYGYLETGPIISGKLAAWKVRSFAEKPGRAEAARYVRSGRFLWNGGIFTWRISAFGAAMKKAAPQFGKLFDKRRLSASYRKLPKLSIDYALLEKAKNLAVVKTRMDWCDMGSWDMFHDRGQRDGQSNLVHGPCFYDQVKGSLIVNHHRMPLVTLGIKDLIVVQTKQGTLICKKGFSEEAALLSRRI